MNVDHQMDVYAVRRSPNTMAEELLDSSKSHLNIAK